MDVLALVISALSLLIAGVGTYQANKRANEALAESRKAAEDARWFAVQEAVQRLIGFDPTAEPVGERLANLRITSIALVDQLDGWDGIDSWLEAERTLGEAAREAGWRFAFTGFPAPLDESTDDHLIGRLQPDAATIGRFALQLARSLRTPRS